MPPESPTACWRKRRPSSNLGEMGKANHVSDFDPALFRIVLESEQSNLIIFCQNAGFRMPLLKPRYRFRKSRENNRILSAPHGLFPRAFRGISCWDSKGMEGRYFKQT